MHHVWLKNRFPKVSGDVFVNKPLKGCWVWAEEAARTEKLPVGVGRTWS